ncbi:hypothetical protein BOX15_Mlig014458g1 [Paramuricea clavata]|uniref:Uncharacterized protein n=1 Tax=Paramuricea clavata TaxID=317549 RepID=A0A7D9EBJ8_PARCT|nr:hypothetical protein BOX15_Mlig014458g1 [Paramuricea clavata]
MCEYDNQTDSIIRDQIVACCSSTKLRRKLLETPNISLQEALKTARSLEAAEMHAKAIEKSEISENNNPESSSDELSSLRQHRKPSDKRKKEPDWVERARKQEQQQTRKSPSHETCYRCGELGHRICDKARGKTCSRGGKRNHFAKACRSTQGPPARNDEMNALHRGETAVEFAKYVSRDSSEEEIFTLQAPHPDINKNNARMSPLLNGFPTTLLVDSGASVNVLPLHVYQKVKQLGSKPEPTSTCIYPYGSSQPLKILGACHITVDAFGKTSSVEFVIVNHKGTTILGRDTSMEMGILHVGPPNHQTHGLHSLASEQENTATEIHTDAAASKVTPDPRHSPSPTTEQQNPIPEPESLPTSLRQKNIFFKYRKVFEGLGRVKGVDVEIRMKKDTTPVVQPPPSRVAVHLREALNKEIAIQESLAIIEPVEGPTPWARITQDWRDVNAHVEREISPYPHLKKPQTKWAVLPSGQSW